MTDQERQERMENLFEKMLNMEMTNREIYEQCRNVAHKPMTNEEWLRSASTEQLADWIASVVQKAISIKENNGIVMLESATWWDEWLKQPHTGGES